MIRAEMPKGHVAVGIDTVLGQDVAQIPIAAASLRECGHRLALEITPAPDFRTGYQKERQSAVQRAADDTDTPAFADGRQTRRRTDLADMNRAVFHGAGHFRPAEYRLYGKIDAFPGKKTRPARQSG
ncbi:hypothetical protein ABK905_11860 [Acerihabitans sp. KWT182]|uniref:Resolvase/invertase-type recombinase catalytic domain-containing protein n=1 Tax=Acerihabitans sp. KWT182 TaxID=3157919 RepID=A0AAU7QEM7_9GAMM